MKENRGRRGRRRKELGAFVRALQAPAPPPRPSAPLPLGGTGKKETKSLQQLRKQAPATKPQRRLSVRVRLLVATVLGCIKCHHWGKAQRRREHGHSARLLLQLVTVFLPFQSKSL